RAEDPRSRRRARVLAATVPAAVVDLRQSVLRAPRAAARALGRRDREGPPQVRGRSRCRVALRRLPADAPPGPRTPPRVRRPLLPLLRGRGPLPAGLAARASRALRAVGRREPRRRRIGAARGTAPGPRLEPRPLRAEAPQPGCGCARADRPHA